jgi:hypothetical protein
MVNFNLNAQELQGDNVQFYLSQKNQNFEKIINDSIQQSNNLDLKSPLAHRNLYSIYNLSNNNFSLNNKKINFSTFSYNNNFLFEPASLTGSYINYNINDKFSLSGNFYIYDIFPKPFDYNRNKAFVSNMSLTYNVNDWLYFRVFGMYAYHGMKDPLLISMFAPHNSFGGEVIVKFSDTFKLGGGVKLVNQGNDWIPQYYALPIFNYTLKKR